MRHVILHDATGSFLLLQKDHSKPDSPHLIFETGIRSFDGHARHVYQRITGKQSDATRDPPLSVRYFINGDDDEDDEEPGTYVLEATGRRCNIPLSSDCIWASINPVLIKYLEHRYSPRKVQAIKDIADETLDNPSNDSVPWFLKRGAVKQVRETIRSRLKQYGYNDIESVEHRYSTSSSMIFYIKTTETSLFYKTSVSCHPEALFTRTLAMLLPEHVVIPFGVDINDNSFFTENFGLTIGAVVPQVDDEYLRKYLMEPAIDKIADFHEHASKHVKKLKELGMEDTSPQQMRIELPYFISELQERGILNREEAQNMQDLLPFIVSKLNVLADGKIPLTVCHGDLHDGNIVYPLKKDDVPLLFDWFECTISHPFLDYMSWTFAKPPWPEIYAEKWKEYDSPDHLLEMLCVAEELAPLWKIFRLVKTVVRRMHRHGAKRDWRLCRVLMTRFIKYNQLDATGTCKTSDSK